MAKAKKESKKRFVANPDSPFWHPEAGGKISGTFKGFTKTLIGPVLQLQTAKGEIPVGIGANLKSLLRPVAASMKAGDKVEILYVGTKKTAKNRNVKTYKLWLKGKELLPENVKPVTGAAVAEMFA